MSKVVIDTNVLLVDPTVLFMYDNVLLPIAILEELDGLKKAEGELGYKARTVIKTLEGLDNIDYICRDYFNFNVNGWDIEKNDNQIIFCAKEFECKLITNDLNMKIKAKSIGVETENYVAFNPKNDYKGYREIYLNEEEQAHFYLNMNSLYNFEINEYCIIKDLTTKALVDTYKWTSNGFMPIVKKPLDSLMFAKIKPKDIYQELAIDSLNSNKLSVLTGVAGTAKTLLSLGYIFQQLQKDKLDQVIIIHNPVAMNKSTQLGYYSGDRTQKLLQTSLGGILSSKLGGMMTIETLMNQGKLMLMPLADARGFETTENSCLYITEGQNLDIYLLKTVLQRAKEGTKVIVEGDIAGQCDHANFSYDKNGMRRAIEVFKGNDCFSCVELQNIYRSKIAEIADKM